MSYQSLGKYVLEVVKKRLDNMCKHRAPALPEPPTIKQKRCLHLRILRLQKDRTKERKASEIPSSDNAQSTNETMTVEELMEAYDGCSSSLRKTQARRRTTSFKRISPANFSKEARLQVPEAILQKIKSLNSLDMELYKHAQHIFEQQKSRLLQQTVQVEVPGDDRFKKDSHKLAEHIFAQQKSPLMQKSLKVDMQEDNGFKDDQYGVLVFILKNISICNHSFLFRCARNAPCKLKNEKAEAKITQVV
ncbi:hypothetical protein MKX01_013387 [Papaver californicum]|nr:hypothetical protein MKX01_013387 [Papaver californicum]